MRTNSCDLGLVSEASKQDDLQTEGLRNWRQLMKRWIIPERGYVMTNTEKFLKEAFAGESQANRKYSSFAKKADKEGFAQAAKLLEHRANVFDALITSAEDPDYKSHNDRKLFLELTGDYVPSSKIDAILSRSAGAGYENDSTVSLENLVDG